MCRIEDLFDLSHTFAGDYLKNFIYPWEALQGIKAFILSLGEKLDPSEYIPFAEQVWVHRTAQIAPGASLTGPAIIGPNAQIRHGAFVRGSALVGENCVVGNSVELKNVILFDGVQVPHYNYVGDSILGYKAHMGAGSVTSNVKSDKTPVVIHAQQELPTGLKKVGAFLGDFAEVGCNTVLNPGTVVGRCSHIYPQSSVRGFVPPDSIYKTGGVIVRKNKE